MNDRDHAKKTRRPISKFVQDLLFSSMPDLGRLDFLQGMSQARGRSWFDRPRLLRRYHRKRRAARRVRKQCRRARAARGQNLRTGARK